MKTYKHVSELKMDQEITIMADEEEQWMQEKGTIIGRDSKHNVVTLELLPLYKDGCCDDGIREVEPNQIKKE